MLEMMSVVKHAEEAKTYIFYFVKAGMKPDVGS
jgi:hypothetical protein